MNTEKNSPARRMERRVLLPLLIAAVGGAAYYLSIGSWGISIFLIVVALWGIGGVAVSKLYRQKTGELSTKKQVVNHEMPYVDDFAQRTRVRSAIASSSLLVGVTALVLLRHHDVSLWLAIPGALIASGLVTAASMVIVFGMEG
jgi:hypothetical protein